VSARLTWLGHSTVLIDLDGARVLTDPLLRRRVLHLRRGRPLPDELGALDAVLVSHVHWDHLDLRSLSLLPRSTTIIVPRDAGGIVRRFENVVELEAGDRIEVGGLEVRATPAAHNIGRWGGRRSSSDAVGYVLNGSRSIYFAGDTDLYDGMSELSPLEAAVLPVGGWGSRVPEGHLDPLRAAMALRLLKPRIAVPIHWGTYAPLWARPGETAGEEFRRRAQELAPEVEVRVLPILGSTEL
jgi:L-ascorbate metabolism protein UlaG (beta-lactamase superfamily)